MKTIITAALCLAFVLIPVSPARPQPQPKIIAQCAIGIVVLAIGATCTICMIRVCKKLPPVPTNPPPPPPPPPKTNFPGMTNRCPGGKTYAMASTWGSSASFQCSTALPGSTWETAYTFVFTQGGDGSMTAVAYRAGVPVMTNTAPIVDVGGEPGAVLDFSALNVTNRGTFFRIAE